jgi:hypothetical protein
MIYALYQGLTAPRRFCTKARRISGRPDVLHEGTVEPRFNALLHLSLDDLSNAQRRCTKRQLIF